ncbi:MULTISPECIES: competence/damage-inducible protein A [Maribacter]|uniref:CinA-like protein n=1 Tax=Maribacter flavus TaxID=1658664 RepID=A0ABU7ILM7_9FLAO|nr:MULTISPECIES: competence/damage-inducible protein A [Maribacter]MDC6406690.1 competence/damage-inducible protein A [Maribacter sp. PR66]MEE1973868.1 competence/damage-inducible protein A [Maribacter flavus]
MFADIITIGDEILIGQIIDTNSAFIAKELNKIGISVYQITSVQDDREHILQALVESKAHADIVIVTGGLGPTKDDITKHTFCEFFNDELVEDKKVLAHVENLFAKYISNTPISDLNRKQAWVPSKAKVLHNENGTAPGMWFYEDGTTFISLPGVPFEMKHLIREVVVPELVRFYDRPHIIHKTIHTYGMGESAIAQIIEEWENNLPNFVKLAYLPSLGKVRLRLTAKGTDYSILSSAIELESQKLFPLIGDIILGSEEDEELEETISKLLIEKGLTLSTAESFTGGTIASHLTAIPGASAYFKGSVVSYATETKVNVLGVPQALVDTYSVVSEQVAMAMAQGVKKLLDTDFAIATTGNAGPTKGDSDANVGTVYIGIASPTHVFALEFNMGNQRERIVQKSVNKAFELLKKEILKM